MPIYEYECKACGHRLEKLQKVGADPLTDCPACHVEALSRLISAAGFRLAGGGWYETDFKSGNQRNLAGDGGDGGSAKTPTHKDGATAKPDAPTKTPTHKDGATA